MPLTNKRLESLNKKNMPINSRVNKKVCHCYKGKFEDVDDENNSKVRNHCHYTCRYRGLAHTICVLK